MNLNGTWEGSFTYGENYAEAIVGQSVAFKMQINEQDNDLTGTCQDEDQHDNPAKIKGFVDEDFVSFVKTYRIYIGVDENGATFSDPGQPPHEIHYSGTLSEDTIEGIFELGDTHIFARSEAVYEGGTFTMKRLA